LVKDDLYLVVLIFEQNNKYIFPSIPVLKYNSIRVILIYSNVTLSICYFISLHNKFNVLARVLEFKLNINIIYVTLNVGPPSVSNVVIL
jgi:hypothetical protein